MAAIGSSVLPASSSLSNFSVIEFPLSLANTEYTVTIPAAKSYCLQARDGTTLKIRKVSGGDYFTLRQYVPLSVDSLTGSSTIDLIVSSSKPSQVVEVFYWT